MSDLNDKSRVAWVDIAKVIGIFAIVYGHTIQSGITYKYVYSFHVPLFFFLQGVVFSVSMAEKKPFREFVKRKAYTLLLPYYCFAIISTVAMYLVSCFIEDPELDFIKSSSELIINILIGDCEANRPLWFLPCSFVLSVLSYLIIKLSNLSKQLKTQNIILLIAVILSCILLFITEEYTNIRFLPWKADGAVHMISFFIMGYMLNASGGFSKLSKISILPKICLVAFLLVIGAVCGIMNEVPIYRSNYYGNIGMLLISAFSTIMGICILSMLIPNNWILSRIGKSTLCILLMHKFPVLFFQKIFPFTGKLLKAEFVPMGLFVTIISIFTCCIAEIIIEKTCPFIIGKSKKHN